MTARRSTAAFRVGDREAGPAGVDDARDGSLVGLKMHLRLAPAARRALEGRVELCFLDGSYIGLELIENGIANLCFVLPRATVARLGSGWPPPASHFGSALPSLAERLAGAEPLWTADGRGLSDRRASSSGTRTAIYRVGDRLAHIPPFTGDGLPSRCIRRAGGRAHSARRPARRLSCSGAATHGQSHPVGERRLPASRGSSGGRNLMLGAAVCAPGLIGTIFGEPG